MWSLHATGRQSEATEEVRRYRELAAESGLDPSPRFVRVEREVFTTPPPASTPRWTGARVPGRLSSITGRQRELEELDGLLRSRRLVTLVGPGGVGKTTLATQAARQLADDLDDAWIVRLADIDDVASVVPAAIRAVGAPATQPLDGRWSTSSLADGHCWSSTTLNTSAAPFGRSYSGCSPWWTSYGCW